MGETFTCSHCGRTLPLSVRDEFDGCALCESCMDSLTVVCDHCEGLIWRQDNCGDSSITLCSHCRDNHYTECCDCGRLTANDELHFLNEYLDDGGCFSPLVHCFSF